MNVEQADIQTSNDDHHLTANDITKSTMSENKLIKRMFLLCVCHVFMTATRHPIWVLFAKQLGASYSAISAVLFFVLIWKGIGGFICVSLANKYGYDKAVIILLIICVLGVFLECIATNFVILSIGFFVAKANVTYVVLSCIAWLLPHNIAVKYTSYLYATILAAYLLGPIFATIISDFFSFRAVFWINFVFGMITIIYAILFIPCNIQKQIELKQLKSLQYSENNLTQKNVVINADKQRDWENIQIDKEMDEETDKEKETKPTETKQIEDIQETVDEDDIYPIILMKNAKNKEKKSSNAHLSKYEWFMLITALCANMIVPFVEVIFAIYYCLYVVDKFENGNIIYASLQMVLLLIGGIVGKVAAPKIIDKVDKNYRILTKYIIMLVSSLLNVLMLFFVFPYSKNFDLWYLYAFTLGLLFGFFSICTQIIMLEFQPSSHAGYVNGISNLLQSIFQAFGLLFVGLFWDKHHEIMFYILAISTLIAFILSILMAMVQKNLCKTAN